MSQASIVLQPMQWAQVPDIHDVEPLSESDSDCLRAIREVLIQHNSVDRFAITLLHKHFPVSAQEQMVEFTDLEERTLTIKPLDQASPFAANSIQTTWRFQRDYEEQKPLTVCIFRCFSNPHSTPRHVGKHMKG